MNSPSKRIWTVSNALSMMRAVFALPATLAILQHHQVEVLAWCIAAAGTDFFDGYLARKLDQVTELGKILDPIADKILVGAAALAMISTGALPVWFVVIVLARDVIIFVVGIYVRASKNIVLMSNVLGKWTLVSLVLVLTMALFDLPASIEWLHGALEIIAVGMMCASMISYGFALNKALQKK